MKLFGGWLPYIAIRSIDVPYEDHFDAGTALFLGWGMRFVFVGVTYFGPFWGIGHWERD